MAKILVVFMAAVLMAMVFHPVVASDFVAQAAPNSPVGTASDLAQVKDLLQTSLLNVVLLGASWFLWRAYQFKADALAELQQKQIEWLQTVWLQQRPIGMVSKLPDSSEVTGVH